MEMYGNEINNIEREESFNNLIENQTEYIPEEKYDMGSIKDKLNIVFDNIINHTNTVEKVDEINEFQDDINPIFECSELAVEQNNQKTTLNLIDEVVDKTKEYTTLADINKVGGELQKYIEDKNKEYNIE